MPFPTRQGTQAAVDAILRAETAAGRPVELLTYGQGAFELDAPYRVHRPAPRAGGPERNQPEDRFRSGPSLAKFAEDARLISVARVLRRPHRYEHVVAHHVEAYAAARLVGAPRVLYFAHTALGPELPCYGPPRFGRALALVGAAADAWLVRDAPVTAAVSPRLAARLGSARGSRPRYVPVPWPVAAPIEVGERERARESFGLGAGDRVVSYVGNLDAYQGWEDVVDALGRLPASVRVLVATASSGAAIVELARARGVESRLRVVPLGDEASRRRAYAVADVAVVPRRFEGGVPIKLLDALARGVPTVATRRATAGLELSESAHVVRDDDPAALAEGLAAVLVSPTRRQALTAAGPRYIERAHSAAAYCRAMDACTADWRPAPGGS
jgi:glycosyltransferase involved in cell wall biosynthesis